MFSKINFVVPVTPDDKVLKIRNIAGMVAHMIKDPTCTTKQVKSNIFIKQQSESNSISLDFASAAEAEIAHVILRNNLMLLQANFGVVVPEPGNSTFSHDTKHEAPLVTQQDGDPAGITPIADTVTGNSLVVVFVNGIEATIGDGCTAASYLSPQWCGLFAREYAFTSAAGSTIAVTGPHEITVGDSLIVKDIGAMKCFDVVGVSGDTITIGGTLAGTMHSLMLPRKFGNIKQGDVLLWFGSYAGYQLDPSEDIVSYKYITDIL